MDIICMVHPKPNDLKLFGFPSQALGRLSARFKMRPAGPRHAARASAVRRSNQESHPTPILGHRFPLWKWYPW